MWFYGNLDPTDWFVYLLFAVVSFAFIGYRWQLLIVVIGGLFLWPFAIRSLRSIWRFSRVHRARKPGILYCADCGELLGPAPQDFFVSGAACPACKGIWCAAAQLVEGIAKKNAKTARPWLPFPQASEKTKPCPKCGAAMAPGAFSGITAVIYRCEACDGYWSGRTGWLALELRLD